MNYTSFIFPIIAANFSGQSFFGKVPEGQTGNTALLRLDDISPAQSVLGGSNEDVNGTITLFCEDDTVAQTQAHAIRTALFLAAGRSQNFITFRTNSVRINTAIDYGVELEITFTLVIET